VETVARIRPKLAEITATNGSLPVAELYLGGIPRGAVLLLCAAGQLSAADEKMNQLAEHGYESVAADLSVVGAVRTDEAMIADVRTLLDRLHERTWSDEQIGVVGYGLGGRASYLAAAEYVLGSAISVDPVGITSSTVPTLAPLVDEPRPARTAWLGLIGAPGDGASPGGVARFAAALRVESPAYTELVSYPRVAGDFSRDSRDAVAHAASYDAWQRVIEWLNAHVAPRLTPLAEAWRARHPVG
jgi:carboxymethylenebutenolidase